MKETVNQLKDNGFSIKKICETLGINRSLYYRKEQPFDNNHNNHESDDDKVILKQIMEICDKHPYWGYRRVTAWLKNREKISINHKRIYRLMKENNFLVPQKRYKAKRESGKKKPKPNKLNQWWGIDMTKFMVEGVGWVYLVVILDWYSRKTVGYHVNIQSRSKEWLKALNMAVNAQCPSGSQGYGINLMSDNGSQPTSKSFMKECATLEINQAFTAYNNPKGNANTERMMRTIKEELIWLSDWKTLKETQEAIARWIDYDYNTMFVHSAIGYISPIEFEDNCKKIQP